MTKTLKSGVEDASPVLHGPHDAHPRPFTFWRRIQIPIIASAATVLVRGVGPTLRIDKLGFNHIKRIFTSGQPSILCFWHGGLFPILWFARGRPIAVMSSANFDGQWASRVTESLGLKVAVGSSSRGGLNALGVLEERLKQGQHAAFAVDGPRGPRFIAKRGPVYLAKRTGCPIVCMHSYSERAVNLTKSWDRMQLSLPFSRVALVFSPPIYVPPDSDQEMLNRKYAELQHRMELAGETAQSWFSRTPAEQERDRVLLNGPWD